jgi:hypothetical protein
MLEAPRVYGTRKRENGTAVTELALLFPLLFAIFLGFVQVAIYMQSCSVVQYATFMAARAFQVYGDRQLGAIGYPHLLSAPKTNSEQTIAEAVAEKIIFESLVWERKKIFMPGTTLSLDRYYDDGNQAEYDGAGATASGSGGNVHVNFIGCKSPGDQICETGTALEVTYCLPIVFPGIDFLFEMSKKNNPDSHGNPCKANRGNRPYTGIGITYRVTIDREPIEI